MKLPNFLTFQPFVDAKQRMGIPHLTLGDLRKVEISIAGPTYEELKSLENQGLDVELEVVVENPDHTLGYKNKRVILYIRDVAGYGNFESDPRFHIANCRTLRDMRQNNRFGRYVIATKDTGSFSVRSKQGGKPLDKKLLVCQNCLDYLKFGSFELNWDDKRRQQVVRAFSIKGFFEVYPKSLHYEIPKHSELTAPENKYSDNFAQISIEYRRERSWICEESTCGVDLSSPMYRRYLHVHHLDGLKHNNANDNLKALCLYCHAQQFQHQHMRSVPEYVEFQRIRNILLRI